MVKLPGAGSSPHSFIVESPHAKLCIAFHAVSMTSNLAICIGGAGKSEGKSEGAQILEIYREIKRELDLNAKVTNLVLQSALVQDKDSASSISVAAPIREQALLRYEGQFCSFPW